MKERKRQSMACLLAAGMALSAMTGCGKQETWTEQNQKTGEADYVVAMD